MQTLRIEIDFETVEEKDSFIKSFEEHFGIKNSKKIRYKLIK